MTRFSTAFFLGGLFLLTASVAQAQMAFHIGPQIGLNVAGITNTSPTDNTITYRRGVEAGVQSELQFGHLAVQPSLRFSQKGLHYHKGIDLGSNEADYRINYLTLPVNLAYCLRADGQGLQIFAGPYVGLLLGGSYQSVYRSSSGGTYSYEGNIKAGEYYSIPAPGTTTVDRIFPRFDAGLQAGLGYRFGKVLAQADFAFGLTDLAPTFNSAHHRTAQFSLSYLFSPAH
jgi:hypothetical protein